MEYFYATRNLVYSSMWNQIGIHINHTFIYIEKCKRNNQLVKIIRSYSIFLWLANRDLTNLLILSVVTITILVSSLLSISTSPLLNKFCLQVLLRTLTYAAKSNTYYLYNKIRIFKFWCLVQ